MSKEIRFYGVLEIPRLERIYREEYAGNEHHILFRPGEECRVSLDIRLGLPQIIAGSESATKQIEEEFRKLLQRTMLHCQEIGMDVFEEKRATTKGKP